MPRDIITADDVSRGKVSPNLWFLLLSPRANFRLISAVRQPFPDPYLMGAKRLNVPIEKCAFSSCDSLRLPFGPLPPLTFFYRQASLSRTHRLDPAQVSLPVLSSSLWGPDTTKSLCGR